ncbi:mannose-1-phosphate guanylyltransferase [Lachnotalea glycerini]|uniref:mannose-1-phosphate guanylyltransferase n=1 Tax=Lachnotalea glycerini TaxID=1763509 RepID=A0A318END2_9FIRM|nr:mannose-1-phosphate guanylyltransferase [Lachnotalea glycerini]PXV87259.1 mannose-1-phosphate guanylyltransferase [Lachnotalea glycerini]
MKTYGVIMAGGSGTRFWPLSRKTTPKQLLNLSGNGLMINETIDRMNGFIKKENIFIVTNKDQSDKMKALVEDGIRMDHILSEPAVRNTSACIGYAAMEIIKKYGDGVMCIFPSDHYIKEEESFSRVLKEAVKVAEESDRLVTIGITPTFPSTGYGYIKFDETQAGIIRNVERFVEKPNHETAVKYLKSGDFLWNSGMFVWKASTIIENFKRFLPRVYNDIIKIGDAMNTIMEVDTINEVYPNIPSISIDYGIMERSDEVVVLEGNFGWNDVGSWDMLGALYDTDENGNIIKGEQINLETSNCISYSDNRLIATIGINNTIIVETDDVVLVCAKDKAQDVKKIVDIIKMQGKYEYL